MDLPPSKGVCSSTQGRIFSVWQESAGIGLFNVIIHHVTPKSAFKKPRRCPRVRAVHETGGADHGRITDQKSCAQQIRREKDGCEFCGCKMKVQYQRCAGCVMRCHALSCQLSLRNEPHAAGGARGNRRYQDLTIRQWHGRPKIFWPVGLAVAKFAGARVDVPWWRFVMPSHAAPEVRCATNRLLRHRALSVCAHRLTLVTDCHEYLAYPSFTHHSCSS